MNWKLIFGLSLFGLAMAFATVYFIPSNVEPYVWLVIFLICSYFIAKNAPGKYFLHGFLVCLIDYFWMMGAHIILSKHYINTHTPEAAQYAKMNTDLGLSIAGAIALISLVIGIISGIVLGLFAFAASKMLKKI